MSDLFADELKPKRGRPSTPKPPKPAPKKRGPKPKAKALPDKPKGRLSKKDREPGISGMNYALNNIVLKNSIDVDSSSIDINKKGETIELLDQIEKIVNEVNFKEKMTVKELKFIEYHLVKGETIKRAMMLAGYRDLENNHLYWLAKKIVNKYEERAADHRTIMRAIGAGEAAVSAGLLHLARTATSEVARVQAYTTLAKMLGMQKDILQGNEGVTVIIQGPDACVQVNAGQAPTLPGPTTPAPYQHPTSTIPGKPITITK